MPRPKTKYGYVLTLESWHYELTSFLVNPYPIGYAGRDFYQFLLLLDQHLTFNAEGTKILIRALKFMAAALVHRARIKYDAWCPYPEQHEQEDAFCAEWDELLERLKDLAGEFPEFADPFSDDGDSTD